MMKWAIRLSLILAVSIPLSAATQVKFAEAGHKHRRAAIVAGAIIGGAIAYHHYRKYRKHRHYGYARGYRHYGRNYGYGYRKHRHRHRHYHYGGYKSALANSGIGVK